LGCGISSLSSARKPLLFGWCPRFKHQNRIDEREKKGGPQREREAIRRNDPFFVSGTSILPVR